MKAHASFFRQSDKVVVVIENEHKEVYIADNRGIKPVQSVYKETLERLDREEIDGFRIAMGNT